MWNIGIITVTWQINKINPDWLVNSDFTVTFQTPWYFQIWVTKSSPSNLIPFLWKNSPYRFYDYIYIFKFNLRKMHIGLDVRVHIVQDIVGCAVIACSVYSNLSMVSSWQGRTRHKIQQFTSWTWLTYAHINYFSNKLIMEIRSRKLNDLIGFAAPESTDVYCGVV